MELGLKIWLFVGAILLIIPLVTEAAKDPVCGKYTYHLVREKNDQIKQRNAYNIQHAEGLCEGCCRNNYGNSGFKFEQDARTKTYHCKCDMCRS